MVEVVATDEFEAWYLSLVAGEQDAVDFVVGLLQDRGVTLGCPHSSAIKGSNHAIREQYLAEQARGEHEEPR